MTAAIIGAAESDLGQVAPELTPVDLMAQASRRALAQAGVAAEQVDAVFATSAQLPMAPANLVEYLGLTPTYVDGTNLGGASFVAHLHHAQLAIAAGEVTVALIAYGSTQRSVGRQRASLQDADPYEEPYRPRLPVAAYAMAAARHMHEYGTPREALAEVAVAARQWAKLNPVAWKRDDLTREDVLAAPMVATPLTVLDCCLVTDGGAAVVVTAADRARDLTDRPVYVLGVGEALSHRSISQMPDLTTTAAVESGRRAAKAAGIAPRDTDLAMLYDAFTINTILFLEDLGFCAKGEGGGYVLDGSLRPGGAHPVNTNGGGLSYCHPGMYGLLALVEAVRQLRGEAGARQLPSAETAVVHTNGGVFSAQATAILATRTR